jgi:hypothetical protein
MQREGIYSQSDLKKWLQAITNGFNKCRFLHEHETEGGNRPTAIQIEFKESDSEETRFVFSAWLAGKSRSNLQGHNEDVHERETKLAEVLWFSTVELTNEYLSKDADPMYAKAAQGKSGPHLLVSDFSGEFARTFPVDANAPKNIMGAICGAIVQGLYNAGLCSKTGENEDVFDCFDDDIKNIFDALKSAIPLK